MNQLIPDPVPATALLKAVDPRRLPKVAVEMMVCFDAQNVVILARTSKRLCVRKIGKKYDCLNFFKN